MKKMLVYLILVSMCVACSQSAEKVRDACMEDENNSVFYGENLSAYCDCVYENLKTAEEIGTLTDSIVEAAKKDCDAEYTSFDTNF